jgi:hypothetical protein
VWGMRGGGALEKGCEPLAGRGSYFRSNGLGLGELVPVICGDQLQHALISVSHPRIGLSKRCMQFLDEKLAFRS